MFDKKMSALAVASAIALSSSVAAAQPGVLDLSVADPTCDTTLTPCDTGDNCPAGEVCREFDPVTSFCVPVDAIFCCADDTDCPTAVGGELLTCQSLSGGSRSLCLPAGEEFCGDRTLEQVRACYSLRDTPTRVSSFETGDCDRDGLSNGTEASLGTDHCAAPPQIGVLGDGGGCVGLTGCIPAMLSSCMQPGVPSSTCTNTPDGAGTYCEPAAEALFCCGATFQCPDAGDACVTTADGQQQFCLGHCLELPDDELVNCITNGTGTVPFSQGDCDGDMMPNGMDPEPCGANLPEVDAGTVNPGIDAGMEPPPIEPTFSGGGGCACGAAVPVRGATPGVLALAMLALLWRARRR